jgi:hypothetical protein
MRIGFYMTDISPLPSSLTTAVLTYLNMPAAFPCLPHLELLIGNYTKTVPWESAFRIVKRNETKTAVCSRWPAEFWDDALTRGGGGTCFESNLAFFSLLRALGYDGYLTINNMGETIGCHTAIIIQLDGVKWLVDAGFPIYQPLEIYTQEVTQRSTPFMDYVVRPNGRSHYEIERTPHPERNAFTLIDKPVDAETYLSATTADYGEKGFFLDKVVINKVVNGRPYRFNSLESATQLVHFWQGERFVEQVDDDGGTAVAKHFAMDEHIVRKALKIVNQKS